MLNVKRISIHNIELKLKQPFMTAIGTVHNRPFLIAEIEFEGGVIGWGECSAFETPWYTEETIETCRYALETFLIPLIFSERSFRHPEEVTGLFSRFRGHHMAKSCIETGFWDAYSKLQGTPLYEVLGGSKTQIDVGTAIGLQSNEQDLLKKVEDAVGKGYKRIKVKIRPGADIGLIDLIRTHYPDIPLMADANSSYTLHHLEHLKQLDRYNLMMIEQPLGQRDFVEHAELQQQLTTPICLDESICSVDDALTSITLNSSKIITIKMSRVGGLSEALKIHALCKERGVDVWAGGMIESGISRAHNIALSTLDGFTIPGDISASQNYWAEDIIAPEVTVENGSIRCSTLPGIGYEVSSQALEKYRISKQTFK